MANDKDYINKGVAYTYFTLQKSATTEDADGNLYVYGKATGDDLDIEDQIMDRGFLKKAMGEWFHKWGNIRQQHNASLAPAGKAVEFHEKDDGFYLKSLIVEPTAKELVKSGVYQAYSIGINNARVVYDPTARNGRVMDGTIVEFSLVDYPANTTCKFMIAKAMKNGEVDLEPKFLINNEEIALPDYEQGESETTRVIAQVTKALESTITKGGIIENKDNGLEPVKDPVDVPVEQVKPEHDKATVTTPEKAVQGDVKKAADVELPGDEAAHDTALTAALGAVKALLTQELAEDDCDVDNLYSLTSVLSQLKSFEKSETLEGLGIEEPGYVEIYCSTVAENVKVGKPAKEWAPELTKSIKKEAPEETVFTKLEALLEKFTTATVATPDTVTEEVTKSVTADLETKVNTLEKELKALQAQPDPAKAPIRMGAGITAAVKKSAEGITAERDHRMKIASLQRLADANSGVIREAALDQLHQLQLGDK